MSTLFSANPIVFQRFTRKKVSPDWFDFWLNPSNAVHNPPFIRTVNGKKIRSELREEDVAMIRIAGIAWKKQSDGEGSFTPEFKRALLERVLANQEADGIENHDRRFILSHDHLSVILGEPIPKRTTSFYDDLDDPYTNGRKRCGCRSWPAFCPHQMASFEAALKRQTPKQHKS